MTGQQQDTPSKPLKVVRPVVTQAPSPTPEPTGASISPDQIRAGLTEFGGGTAPPVASYSAQLAQLGNELARRYPNIDPAFIAALALKESGGGQNIPEGSNNPYGIMSDDQTGNRSLAQYPDFGVATLGGGQNDQQGLRGTLFAGPYDEALQSGNLEQFFNTYSPPSENALTAQQVVEFLQLLEYFNR